MVGFFNDIPAFWAGAIIVAASLVFAVVGIKVIARVEPPEMRHTYNDIVGFVIAVVGVVYAVLLAWAAIAVWETHDRAEMAVEREASLLGDVADLALGLEGETAVRLRAAAVAYADAVVSREWPAMREGTVLDVAGDHLAELQRIVFRHASDDPAETLIQTELIERLGDLADTRRDRLFLGDWGMHPVIWSVIVLGSVVLVGLSFFFGLEIRRHQILTGTLSVSVALVVFMILELDRPFMGDVSVGDESFRLVAERIRAPGGAT